MELPWYTSIRISSEHNFILARLNDLFTEEDWYIAFPHMGKNKDNPHFHVYIQYHDDATIAQYRRKFRTAFGTGNRYFSIKRRKNGLSSGLTYGSKEGTDPTTKGDVTWWLANFPAWIPGLNPMKRKRNVNLIDPDGDEFNGGVRVNKYNLVAFAHQFWRKNLSKQERAKDYTLEEVFKLMMKTQEYTFHFTEKFSFFHFSEFRSRVDPDCYVKWWNWKDREEAMISRAEEEAEEKD